MINSVRWSLSRPPGLSAVYSNHPDLPDQVVVFKDPQLFVGKPVFFLITVVVGILADGLRNGIGDIKGCRPQDSSR
jgi:hypothetical protein